MERLDRLHLGCPVFGRRKLAVMLSSPGEAVNRKRVQRLMRVMGLGCLFCRPKGTVTLRCHKRYPEIFTTDPGVPFTTLAWTNRAEAAGVNVRQDGAGRCPDDLFVERLWRRAKPEDLHPKRYACVRELEAGLRSSFAFSTRFAHTNRSGIGRQRAFTRGKRSAQRLFFGLDNGIHHTLLRSTRSIGALFCRRTTQTQRPGPREAWIATGARGPGSLQRMVRLPSHNSNAARPK